MTGSMTALRILLVTMSVLPQISVRALFQLFQDLAYAEELTRGCLMTSVRFVDFVFGDFFKTPEQNKKKLIASFLQKCLSASFFAFLNTKKLL